MIYKMFFSWGPKYFPKRTRISDIASWDPIGYSTLKYSNMFGKSLKADQALL